MRCIYTGSRSDTNVLPTEEESFPEPEIQILITDGGLSGLYLSLTKQVYISQLWQRLL
jgi:hypothetical protein